MPDPKYKTGIVLSGGGARGFAHIGILKALNENGIFPEVISGVSAGAIVGSLYADGYKPDDILRIFLDLDLFKLLQIGNFRLGLMKPDGLRKVLLQALKAQSFEDLKLPLSICCTNLDLAETVYFDRGVLIDPIIASSAFPFFIKPHVIDGHHYIDGGLMNNLPVQPLLNRCEKIIGVYVNPVGQLPESIGATNYTDRIIHMGLRANMLSHVQYCDLFLEPPELARFNLLKLSGAREIYKIGYEYASRILTGYPDLNAFKS